MALINLAYTVLSDPQKRAEFDLKRQRFTKPFINQNFNYNVKTEEQKNREYEEKKQAENRQKKDEQEKIIKMNAEKYLKLKNVIEDARRREYFVYIFMIFIVLLYIWAIITSNINLPVIIIGLFASLVYIINYLKMPPI